MVPAPSPVLVREGLVKDEELNANADVEGNGGVKEKPVKSVSLMRYDLTLDFDSRAICLFID